MNKCKKSVKYTYSTSRLFRWLIIEPSKITLSRKKCFYFEGRVVTCFIACARACVSDLTLLSSPVPPWSGMRAAGTNSSSGGREIRFRRAAPPGPLEAASGALSKRLPPLLLTSFRKKQNSIKPGGVAESRAACMICEHFRVSGDQCGVGGLHGDLEGALCRKSGIRLVVCDTVELNTVMVQR